MDVNGAKQQSTIIVTDNVNNMDTFALVKETKCIFGIADVKHVIVLIF